MQCIKISRFCFKKQNRNIAINGIYCLPYNHSFYFYMFPSADGAPQARVTALHILFAICREQRPSAEKVI